MLDNYIELIIKRLKTNYIITRIWHLINDLDIKIITQQYVIRPNNEYTLNKEKTKK